MLSPRQQLAAQLLAGGLMGRQVAEQCHVGEKTVSVWRQLPEFKQELAKCQHELLAEARAKLLGAATATITNLAAISAQGEDLTAAVAAGKALLTHLRLNPHGNDAGIENHIGRSSELPQHHQAALQAIEAYQAGYDTDESFISYLNAQEYLDDPEAIEALTSDSEFLQRTLRDYQEWIKTA
jgi:hypothetical protein